MPLTSDLCECQFRHMCGFTQLCRATLIRMDLERVHGSKLQINALLFNDLSVFLTQFVTHFISQLLLNFLSIQSRLRLAP